MVNLYKNVTQWLTFFWLNPIDVPLYSIQLQFVTHWKPLVKSYLTYLWGRPSPTKMWNLVIPGCTHDMLYYKQNNKSNLIFDFCDGFVVPPVKVVWCSLIGDISGLESTIIIGVPTTWQIDLSEFLIWQHIIPIRECTLETIQINFNKRSPFSIKKYIQAKQ